MEEVRKNNAQEEPAYDIELEHKVVVEYLINEFKERHGIDLGQDESALQRLKEAADIAISELASAEQTEINLPSIFADANGTKDLNVKLTRSELELLKETEEIRRSNEEEIARMQRELEEAKSQSEAATDMMLRLAAELDNYKKRTIKERESLIKYANQNIIRELLPVLDNFERAVESANKSRDFDALLDGVKLILNQMSDVLEKEGVRRIEAVGKIFDPSIHEAVLHVPSEEYPENTIIDELQKGYILHDRVIRPSMVTVSKGAPKGNE